MKRLVPILALLVMAVVAVVLLRPWSGGGEGPAAGGPGESGPGPAPSGGSAPPAEAVSSTVRRTPVPPKEPVVVEQMVAVAERLNDQSATVEDDLSVVGELIRAYTRYIGIGPEGGLNEEIVECLQGANPMKLILVAKDHSKINEAGELVDRFGTPYYFHPVSGTEIEIRSAGPDKLLWSKDDVLYE